MAAEMEGPKSKYPPGERQFFPHQRLVEALYGPLYGPQRPILLGRGEQLVAAVKEAFTHFRPGRRAEVLTRHFGLEDGIRETKSEIAGGWKVSRTHIGNIVPLALNKVDMLVDLRQYATVPKNCVAYEIADLDITLGDLEPLLACSRPDYKLLLTPALPFLVSLSDIQRETLRETLRDLYQKASDGAFAMPKLLVASINYVNNLFPDLSIPEDVLAKIGPVPITLLSFSPNQLGTRARNRWLGSLGGHDATIGRMLQLTEAETHGLREFGEGCLNETRRTFKQYLLENNIPYES